MPAEQTAAGPRKERVALRYNFKLCASEPVVQQSAVIVAHTGMNAYSTLRLNAQNNGLNGSHNSWQLSGVGIHACSSTYSAYTGFLGSSEQTAAGPRKKRVALFYKRRSSGGPL